MRVSRKNKVQWGNKKWESSNEKVPATRRKALVSLQTRTRGASHAEGTSSTNTNRKCYSSPACTQPFSLHI